jgi:hypothetical protein
LPREVEDLSVLGKFMLETLSVDGKSWEEKM